MRDEGCLRTVENCRLDDVPSVRRLRHLKRQARGARFFDDDAMRRIQPERAAFSESVKARD
jgi:hypothetical protein